MNAREKARWTRIYRVAELCKRYPNKLANRWTVADACTDHLYTVRPSFITQHWVQIGNIIESENEEREVPLVMVRPTAWTQWRMGAVTDPGYAWMSFTIRRQYENTMIFKDIEDKMLERLSQADDRLLAIGAAHALFTRQSFHADELRAMEMTEGLLEQLQANLPPLPSLPHGVKSTKLYTFVS